MTATGLSIRAVCRVVNRNSCGSGSICGQQPDGKALILTNAHVAGTTIGRIVDVDVESTGDRIKARVIMAAYSDRTVSDWAILETVEPYTKVKPVHLSKKKPYGSNYTKGFPRCQPHAGTDIETVDFGSNGVWFWEPDSIGGQSGSGVWNDNDHLQYGLLTWLWNGHGAGQQTAEIYRQATGQTVAGYPKPDGLIELADFDLKDSERGENDPVVEPGFFQQVSIADLPIWAEDIIVDPPKDPDEPPPTPGTSLSRADFMEYCRDMEELHAKWRNRFENTPAPPVNGSGGGSGTFGL